MKSRPFNEVVFFAQMFPPVWRHKIFFVRLPYFCRLRLQEARVAREEARRVRLDLADSERARQAQAVTLRDLETSNRLLRTKIVENSLSFRAALESAHKLLLSGDCSSLPVLCLCHTFCWLSHFCCTPISSHPICTTIHIW